ncbi:MAG: hypothetical protein U9N56_11515 [Actinomycetota bacterium]|nr:hypothetical protein [Actinomycetota bacterium]
MNEATHALEEIRRTELEAARHIEDARTQAAEIVAQAKAQSRLIADEGRERGMAAARNRLERALEEAAAEAATIRARNESQSKTLGKLAAESMESLIEEMVSVVLAPPSEPGK